MSHEDTTLKECDTHIILLSPPWTIDNIEKLYYAKYKIDNENQGSYTTFPVPNQRSNGVNT